MPRCRWRSRGLSRAERPASIGPSRMPRGHPGRIRRSRPAADGRLRRLPASAFQTPTRTHSRQYARTNGRYIMPEITAAAVKDPARADRPAHDGMQQALQETRRRHRKGGRMLRKEGKKTMEKRSGRDHHLRPDRRLCRFRRRRGRHDRSALRKRPGGQQRQFMQLATDLAQQLATGPGAATAEELLAQPSPSQPAADAGQQFEDLNNRIREVFKLERASCGIDGACGGYAHHNGASRRAAAGRGRQRRRWPRTSACTSPPCGRRSSSRTI